jgi:hypothetical protein
VREGKERRGREGKERRGSLRLFGAAIPYPGKERRKEIP